MFISSYRIYDRYHLPIESLAILADETVGWRPTAFAPPVVWETALTAFAARNGWTIYLPWETLEASTNRGVRGEWNCSCTVESRSSLLFARFSPLAPLCSSLTSPRSLLSALRSLLCWTSGCGSDEWTTRFWETLQAYEKGRWMLARQV